jgi:GNAT superfamily N-acetyltransferase
MDALALARLVEGTEAAAFEDLIRAAPPALGFTAEHSDDGVLLAAPGFDALLFNRAIGLFVGRPATPETARRLIERLRRGGTRNYGVQLSPAAQPESTSQWLCNAGLEAGDNWTKVCRAAGEPASVDTPLRVEPVGAGRKDQWAAVACTGFGLAPVLLPIFGGTVGRRGWYHYLAWDAHEPVAAAALFINRESGWLGAASTLPAHRRRGAQSALMARRIADATALGCRWLVTETDEDLPERPNPSFHNMMRAGFTVAYQRRNFIPAARVAR